MKSLLLRGNGKKLYFLDETDKVILDILKRNGICSSQRVWKILNNKYGYKISSGSVLSKLTKLVVKAALGYDEIKNNGISQEIFFLHEYRPVMRK
jgi:hypothetical protein